MIILQNNPRLSVTDFDALFTWNNLGFDECTTSVEICPGKCYLPEGEELPVAFAPALSQDFN